MLASFVFTIPDEGRGKNLKLMLRFLLVRASTSMLWRHFEPCQGQSPQVVTVMHSKRNLKFIWVSLFNNTK